MIRVQLLRIAIGVVSFFVASSPMAPIAFCWGNRSVYWPGTEHWLVNRVLKRREVRFSVENHAPDRFKTEDVAAEVRQSILTWLSVVPTEYWSNIQIRHVGIEESQRDVHIVIAANADQLNSAEAYVEPLRGLTAQANAVSVAEFIREKADQAGFDPASVLEEALVRFGSWNGSHFPQTEAWLGLTVTQPNLDGTLLHTIAYNATLNGTGSLAFLLRDRFKTQYPEFLNDISMRHPSTTVQVASMLGTSKQNVFLSSYAVILHEIGHAFGLTDTYRGAFLNQVDPKHRSHDRGIPMFKVAPKSLMHVGISAAKQLYPSQDDQRGIRHLFKRFAHSLECEAALMPPQ